MPDSLSDRYTDLLTGSYDCVDRIVLNGYFRPGHNSGGFRIWWLNLTGSVDTLDNTHLMRMAGRFSRPHGSQNRTALDRHYEAVRASMAGILKELGVAA